MFYPCCGFYNSDLYESKYDFHMAKLRWSIAPLCWMFLLHVYVIEALGKVLSGRFMYPYL